MRKIFLFLIPLLFSVFFSNAQLNTADDNVALQLVSANKASLGLSDADLSNVKVSNTYQDNASGIRMVYLQQTYKGIPVYNQMLVLAFKNNKLISNAGTFNHSMEKFANVASGIPAVSAEGAVQSALSDRKLVPTQMAVPLGRKDNGNKIEFSNMGISRENITAQLLWAPVEETRNNITALKKMKLAWQVYIIPKTTSDYWLVKVDASDNSIIGMDNLTVYDNWGRPELPQETGINYPEFTKDVTRNISGNNAFDFKKINSLTEESPNSPTIVNSATYRVIPFPAESPIHPGGTPATRTDPWTAAPGNPTTLKWHTGAASTNYTYTRGNNVWAYQDQANANTGSVATSASSTTTPDPLTFDFVPNFTVAPTQTTPVQNQQFNITNLFYWNNIIHDVMYIYGFNEASANFQDDNQGRGGVGNDHVNAEAQDGSGTNNANFSTPADGGSGRMQMYLWTLSSPQRDGDVDNGIITHEHGHGISNRFTGGGIATCLGNAEQMGEGWSDYYCLMFTQDWSTATLNTGFNSPRGIGTYALNQPITGLGIRSQKYCTDFTVNNKVYAASIPAAPHDRGEIWCATLWDMTWNIINQNGSINANLYDLAGGGGNNIALKLVTEGLRLQQCSPGFISGRNAILQADQNLYGGQYNCAIWEAFRRRGMGAFASEGSTNSVTDQIPDFTPPITLAATQNGTVSVSEGQNIIYANKITTCSPIANYTATDTLPTNVTYVSGGTYNAANRVVSFNVSQAAGTTSYPFTVTANVGSYFPPVTLLNETVAGATIPSTWTTTATPGNVWSVVSTQSSSAPNSFFVENLVTAADQKLETTSAIALPANSYPRLTFKHRYNTEAGWDGGVVEISTNGGATWTDLGPNMTSGGYNGGLGAGVGNNLSGRAAFTGASVGAGLPVTTVIGLAAYAGQSVKIRFRFASDDNTAGTGSPTGWWVDDIVLDAVAAVNMRTSLFNASNVRVSFKDTVTLITPLILCSPNINSQPVSTTVCANSTASFSCVATATGGVTYQWQVSTNGGGTWTDVPGATASTYSFTALLAQNGNLFRCVVTGSCNPTATSLSATLSVAAASVGGSVSPSSTSVCGTTNSGTITLSGHTGAVIRWESATVLAGPYTAIANTTTTLTFTNLTQTTYFRAVVQVPGCVAVNSTVATVTFNASLPLSIAADPGTTICAGDPVRLTASEPGGPAVPYTITTTFANNNAFGMVIFNFKNNNPFPVTITGIESIASASGASTATLYYKTTPISGAPGAISAANGWNVAATGAYTAVANTTTTTPQVFLTGATLVIPAGATYGLGVESKTAANVGNLRYSTVAAGVYTISAGGCDLITGTNIGYAGDISPAVLGNTPRGFIGNVNFTGVSVAPITTGTFLWTPAAGLNSTTTNPVAASPAATTTYTVFHDNGAGCVRQASITINVNQLPKVTAQPVNTTVCSGLPVTFTVGATGAGIAYQWQESTNGGVTYTNLVNAAPYSGVTTTTLTISPTTGAMNNNRYRCVISGTCPPNANSNGAILTVVALPVVTVTPASTCGGVAGTNGTLLTASGATTYTWAPIAGLYTDATAVTAYTGTSTPIVYAAPTAFTAYTVSGTNATTGCVGTAVALVNYTPPAPTVTPASVLMCLGDPAVKLKSSSSQSFTGTFTSGTVNIVIPDGPAIPPVPTTYPATTSTITVAGIPAGATIANIRAKFNITHAYVGDLVMVLKAPNGRIFNLDAMLNKTNNPGANFTNTVISSAGTTLLSAGAAPFTATFKPDAVGATFAAFGFTFPGGPVGFIPDVATFSGLYSVPNGTWTLAVYDAGAPDAGVLNNWSLDIDYIVGVPATPAVWTPAAGLFSDASASTPYVAGTAVDSVWTKPTPSGVYTYQATVKSLPPVPSVPTMTNTATTFFTTLTFNVRNNNNYAVTLTDISSMCNVTGATNVAAYYKTTAVNGLPGAITTANGWNQFGTGTITSIGFPNVQPFLSGLTLVIPANTTYGILVSAALPSGTGNLVFSNTGTQLIGSAGGCDIITGSNIGYTGPAVPGAPTFNPYYFIGSISVVPNVTACTSPSRTVVVTVNQPVAFTTQPVDAAVCTDKVASFTAVATGSSITHNWRVSTDNGNTWTDVANGGVYAGAKTTTLTITAPPVSMSGYLYKDSVSTTPCAPLSSVRARLIVNPLPTVVLSASPYKKLFPGLTTTLFSTVTPAAATYTWLRNGVQVPGASASSYLVTVDALGDYTLRVTDINGCTNLSNQVSITDSASGRVFIYPTPNGGLFQVRYYSIINNTNLPRGINVYDARGKRVLTQSYSISAPYARMDVDLRNHGTGVYWIEVVDVVGNRLAMGRTEVLR
ncbi:M36 family metallopeptidase [Ferruginibacter sp. SUN106]|uniref:M36 family metallopeptidase n=1 Tax=Ferruginibacter sp. SUN106 TaxID=2978348 RepID=UPI003D35DE4E